MTLGYFPLELRLAPVLLPLAMVFRRVGIAAMTLGCLSAHLVSFSPPLEVFAAASSAFLGSYFGYLLVRNVFTVGRLLSGCFLITAIWTLIMSLEWAATSGLPWIYTFDLMLARLFLSINLAGFILALAARRLFGKSFPGQANRYALR